MISPLRQAADAEYATILETLGDDLRPRWPAAKLLSR